MAPWVRRAFIHILPRLLVMRRPRNHENTVIKIERKTLANYEVFKPHKINAVRGFFQYNCSEIYRALDGVRYIAECTKREEDSNKVKEDWKYVAMVLDRLFLWIFTVAVLVGSAGIILQAPALYDTRAAIDIKYSEIEAATAKPLSEQH